MSLRAFIHAELRRTMERLPPEKIEEMKRRGYCSVSRAHSLVARVDRPDWRGEMQRVHGRSDMGADFYRRCMSKDVVTLHPDDQVQFHTDHLGEYVPDEGESHRCSLCGQEVKHG